MRRGSVVDDESPERMAVAPDHLPADEPGECAHCGAVASLQCANCKNIYYCKITCQKEHWKRGHREVCFPIKVETNAELGRHLVATQDFQPGDILFFEDPLAVGPKQISEPVCLSCYKKVDGKYRCKRCHWPVCGVLCEKAKDHQPECVVGGEIQCPIEIEKFDQPNHFYEVVLPLRCLTLKKRDPNKYEKMLELASHQEDRKSSPEYKTNQDRIVNMLRNYFMLTKFSEEEIDASENTINKIIGILDTNAVDIPAKGREISGIFPLFSMIEHSCIPNIKYTFSRGKKITVKAALNIKKGEHLQTMYSHILWGTMARREHLKTNWHFLCNCKRCADPTELGTNFSSVKCTSCKEGYLNSVAPLDELADWVCSACNAKVPVAQIKELTLALGDKVEKTLTKPTIRSLEKMINEACATQVHPDHFHLFALKHSLLQMYGRQGELGETIMKKKEKLCQDFLKTCNILDPGVAKLAPYISVALYEYHLAIMSRTEQQDGKKRDAKAVQQDIENARSLLKQITKLLIDEPNETPEHKLREMARKNIKELDKMLKGK